MIKAILFDAFGTLFSLQVHFGELQKLVPDHSEELLRLWREKQLSRTWLLQSMGRYEDFRQVSMATLDQSMKELSLSNTQISELLLPIYLNPTVFDDVISTLSQINLLGCKTYILSNGTAAMLTKGIRNTGLESILEGFISVDEIQQYKPSREVYHYALKKIGCHQDNVLFVSSNQWDVAGASNASIRSVWLNRGQIPFEDFGHSPYAIISSLDELVDLVQSIFHQG